MRRSLLVWARGVRTELGALSIAARRRDVPWHAKAVALFVVAYALSPIDLIPDFIPVLGLLDDAILLPIGILLARRMVPAAVLAECREEAARRQLERRRSIAGLVIVVALWVLLVLAAWTVWRAVR